MKRVVIYFMILGVCGFAACTQKTTKAMYEGNDISNEAKILRDKQTKAATLEVSTKGKWKIYAGKSVETIDFSKPLLEGEGSGVFPLNVSNTERSYFQFATDDGKAILAERHLPMTGGFNFRDIGGLKTKDGKYVKWGKILRSDDLSTLTDSDLVYLQSIPVRTVIDFRSQSEIDMAKDKLLETVTLYRNLNIEPGNIMASNLEFDVDTVDFDQLMLEMNRALVGDSMSIVRYTEFFHLLQNEDVIPLMYHCSAGKDRTGMATALILFSLGVDEGAILNDYLLSAEYLKDKYAKYVEFYPNIEPLMTVKPEFLQAGIDKIKEDYGSVENYLTDVLKVDLNKMKKMFLY
ncbi:tyrosine-protein phosphatase [Paludibacter sp. 221]|uniref:tyrosine-protein phosphatase n=1 Tax=Paludibacter sp. 221 TaxID=2302939 RepID=UPI0013D8E086|nr:tyrosine-protein phosphatase [Paludibacter sp. 221]NDV46431.1 tyrosine-protein phosphatase [Paludibacter sp. 221]